jgi:hypothetical protein
MPYVNEPVPDEAIDRFNLPFGKGGSGHYWTRDEERNIFLSGGLSGNPAFDEPLVGRFHFYMDGLYFLVYIEPGKGSSSFRESPFIVRWDHIISVQPKDLHGISREKFVEQLKETLVAYGRDGAENRYTPDIEVVFGF